MSNFRKLGGVYTGGIYVSKGGNDSNPGTNPDFPKLTIASAIAAASGISQIIIVGDGVWDGFLGNVTNRHIEADGMASFIGLSGQSLLSTTGASIIHGFRITGYSNLISSASGGQEVRFENCIIESIPASGVGPNTPTGLTFSESTLIDCQFSGCGNQRFITDRMTTVNTGLFTRGIIKNSQLGTGINAYLGVDSDVLQTQLSHNNNIQCVINKGNFLNPRTLAEYQTAFPGSFPNCINIDPQYIGNPSRYTQLVNIGTQAAPNIVLTAGENGTPIAKFKTGKLLDANSPEVTTPIDSVRFSVQPTGEWTISNGNDGYRVIQVDLGAIVQSGIRFVLNSFVDFTNDTPTEGNYSSTPNILHTLMEWRDEDAGWGSISGGTAFDTYTAMRHNIELSIDSLNRGNGDEDFDASTETKVTARYIRIAFKMIRNYNPG